MPASPITPRHSRHGSMARDYQSPAPRRTSRDSIRSNLRRDSFPGIHDSAGFGGAAVHSGGGALADELAGAFDNDEDEDEDGCYDEDGFTVENAVPDDSAHLSPTSEPRQARTNGGSVNGHTSNRSLEIPRANGRGHHRQGSEYDGSDYGDESDFEVTGLNPRLLRQIDDIESLARRGTGDINGIHADTVIKRVAEDLRDLGSQASIETHTSRLITAHSALTTHLANQIRQLQKLSYPLSGPFALLPPDAELIDNILPTLTSLAEQLPRPSAPAHEALSGLHNLTNDLISTLNYLSDTLHMSRQVTTTAARRLRSAKELVVELRQEEELAEEAKRWLERGNWGERLQRRECAAVCGDVVGGFEEVCNGWRARLFAQTETV